MTEAGYGRALAVVATGFATGLAGMTAAGFGVARGFSRSNACCGGDADPAAAGVAGLAGAAAGFLATVVAGFFAAAGFFATAFLAGKTTPLRAASKSSALTSSSSLPFQVEPSGKRFST